PVELGRQPCLSWAGVGGGEGGGEVAVGSHPEAGGVEVVDEPGDERDDRVVRDVAGRVDVDGEAGHPEDVEVVGRPEQVGDDRDQRGRVGRVDVEHAPPVGGGHGTRSQGSLSNMPPRLMTARSTFRSRSVSSAARSSFSPACREKIRPRAIALVRASVVLSPKKSSINRSYSSGGTRRPRSMSDPARAEWPARLPCTATSVVGARDVERIRAAAAASW